MHALLACTLCLQPDWRHGFGKYNIKHKGVVGYDGTAILRNLNIRLDQEDRIALLGANGEGKSTLSKLIAGRLELMNGELDRTNKLKVGLFDEGGNLMAIGRLSSALQKNFSSEAIIKVRLTY